MPRDMRIGFRVFFTSVEAKCRSGGRSDVALSGLYVLSLGSPKLSLSTFWMKRSIPLFLISRTSL